MYFYFKVVGDTNFEGDRILCHILANPLKATSTLLD
jgi:hypothetical protein